MTLGLTKDFVAEISNKNDRLRDFQFTTKLYFLSQQGHKTIGLNGVLITLNTIILLSPSNQTSSGLVS